MSIANLKNLCLDMGHVIRACTEADEHSELWTNDGEYVPDTRFSAPLLDQLQQLECYVLPEDLHLPLPQFLGTVASRILDDLRDGTYVGGPNSNQPAPIEELAMLRRDLERLPKSPGRADALRHMAALEQAIARRVLKINSNPEGETK